MKVESIFHSKTRRFGLSVAAVLLATVGLAAVAERVNPVTVSLILLLIVLSCATFLGETRPYSRRMRAKKKSWWPMTSPRLAVT